MDNSNNQNYIMGNASNIQIQQNTVNSIQQSNTNPAVDFNELLDILAQLSDNKDRMGLPTEQVDELTAAIEEIKKGSNKATDEGAIKKTLNVILDILKRASASMIATGAIQLIGEFIKKIG